VPRLVPPVVTPGSMAGQTQPRLSNGSVGLRPWNHGDAGVVLEAFREPSIQRWHMRVMDDEAEALAWIDGWHSGWLSEKEASWAITTRSQDGTEMPCGYVALRGVDLEFGYAQVTYWVLPGSRGQGAATSACLGVAAWAFEDLGLHRLGLLHSTANVISCRVAVKAGFQPEGTFRSGLLHHDGWHDMHAHGRVNSSD